MPSPTTARRPAAPAPRRSGAPGPRARAALPWCGLAARLVVGSVWVVAGALKLPDPAASVQAVRAYQLLPPALVAPVGQLLPVVEVVVGTALLLGLLTRPVAAVSAALLGAFVAGIASVWARGLSIDCGCFGGGGTVADAAAAYPWEVARDLALLAGSLLVAALRTTPLAADSLLLAPDQHTTTTTDHLREGGPS